MSGRAADLGYAAGWRLVRALPESAAARAFDAAADVAVRRRGRSVRRLAGNLRRVVGPDLSEAELDRLVRQAMRSYARYWREAFRLPVLSPADRLRTFHMVNSDVLAEAAAGGRGVVLALSHSGNWDHAGAWAVASGYGLTTVAERLRPESLFQRFVAFRESLGMRIIPLTGGERPPMDALADRLAAGDLVPLLADRDLSSRGVPVTFFGGHTRMPPGPALLALRTGAPLFAVSMWYEPGRTMCRLTGPLPVPTDGNLSERVASLTQDVADALAAGIAEHPADWHMLQRLWLDQPGKPAQLGPDPRSGRLRQNVRPGGDRR